MRSKYRILKKQSMQQPCPILLSIKYGHRYAYSVSRFMNRLCSFRNKFRISSDLEASIQKFFSHCRLSVTDCYRFLFQEYKPTAITTNSALAAKRTQEADLIENQILRFHFNSSFKKQNLFKKVQINQYPIVLSRKIHTIYDKKSLRVDIKLCIQYTT